MAMAKMNIFLLMGLFLFVGFFLLSLVQIFLSTRENKYYGLILPILSGTFSLFTFLLYTLNLMAQDGIVIIILWMLVILCLQIGRAHV